MIVAINAVGPTTGSPAGMNCGNSATKNTASFGLAKLVTRPWR